MPRTNSELSGEAVLEFNCCRPGSHSKKIAAWAESCSRMCSMDVTHVPCGHLAAVIDCHYRELVGFEFALRGRAREAERIPLP